MQTEPEESYKGSKALTPKQGWQTNKTMVYYARYMDQKEPTADRWAVLGVLFAYTPMVSGAY
jgi:hypothetical protein